jgi:hypothetical protein
MYIYMYTYIYIHILHIYVYVYIYVHTSSFVILTAAYSIQPYFVHLLCIYAVGVAATGHRAAQRSLYTEQQLSGAAALLKAAAGAAC